MQQALYKQIAGSLQAYNNCVKSNNAEWRDKHQDRALNLTKNHMPTGSGIDAGIFLDWEASHPARLVFTFDYHHMTEGMYIGWTSHKLYVTPSLVIDFDMRITGENPDGIKDYFYDIFSEALAAVVE